MSKKDITNSPKIGELELESLKGLFPQFFSERNFDVESFKSYLEGQTTDNNEFYRFEWTGKKNAKQIASKPTKNTLIPDKENSKNWEKTENLFIEGDNLEVLKLLLNKYYGQIKMIYIDPPYNKDKDFVYKDTWKDNLEDYLAQTGQVDEDGETTTEKETTGRKHSNWLNMIYPRLILARKLLREDGVIFVSIDDDEIHNLRKIMDEVFGEDNFLGQIIWETATDNNKSQVSVEHEYVIIYSKNLESQSSWEIISNKAQYIQEKYEEILKETKDINEIQKKLKNWINGMKKSNELDLSGVSHYSYVDEKGVYYPGNSNNTKPGNYLYNIIHPLTNKPCKKPSNGWRWPEITFLDYASKGDVEWGEDENIIPKIKKRIETASELLKSYYYEDNRTSTSYLTNLFGTKVFDNPKSLKLILKLLKFVSSENDIILDFFAGSGTTAHAVMDLNKDGGNRKFICVQLPEKVAKNSEAEKAGYKTISEITRERIKRAGDKIKNEQSGENVDIGFRAFKLAESNFKYLSEKYEINEDTSVEQMELLMKKEVEETGLIDGRNEIDVIYELIIREGYSFYSSIEKLENGVYKVSDENKYFYALIQEKLIEIEIRDFVKKHLEEKQVRFFALEESLSESARATLDTYFNLQNI